MLQNDVPGGEARELRVVPETAARDAGPELIARQVAADHLRAIDPVFDQRALHDDARVVIGVGAAAQVAPRRHEPMERAAGGQGVRPVGVVLVIEQLHGGTGVCRRSCLLLHAADDRAAARTRQSPVEQQCKIREALARDQIDALTLCDGVQYVSIHAPGSLWKLLAAKTTPLGLTEQMLSHMFVPE